LPLAGPLYPDSGARSRPRQTQAESDALAPSRTVRYNDPLKINPHIVAGQTPMAIPVIPFRPQDLICTYRVEVDPEHIDLMGHMNVAHYTAFVVQGFWHYLKDHIVEQPLDVSRHAIFMIEQHTRYLAECVRGETLGLYPRVVGHSKRCVHAVCYLYNETRRRLSAHSELLFMGVNMETRKGGRLSDYLRERFAAVADRHNALAWPPAVCGIMKPF
jgi:acyl-CoA thioester hydrolase